MDADGNQFIDQRILDSLAQAGGTENLRLLESLVSNEYSSEHFGARAALERAGTVEALAALHRGLPWEERGAVFGAPISKLRLRYLRGGESDANRDLRDLCSYARFTMPTSMAAPTFFALAKANDRRSTDLLIRQLVSPLTRPRRCATIVSALKTSSDPRVPPILKRYEELQALSREPSASTLDALKRFTKLLAGALYEWATAARRGA